MVTLFTKSFVTLNKSLLGFCYGLSVWASTRFTLSFLSSARVLRDGAHRRRRGWGDACLVGGIEAEKGEGSQLGGVVHGCTLGTLGAEARGLRVQAQPGQFIKIKKKERSGDVAQWEGSGFNSQY